MRRTRRTVALTVAAALVALTSACATPGPAPVAVASLPTAGGAVPAVLHGVRSIAVLGDSISVGFNACSTAGPCKEANWATGTSPDVQSIAERLGSGRVAVHDLAFPGKRMRSMADELSRLPEPVDLVVVLAGANDLCQHSVSSMTSASTFAVRVQQLLAEVDVKAPHAIVLMMSVPDVVSLSQQQSVPADIAERRVASGACGAVLGDREHGVDATDLAAVRQRMDQYDTAIEAACAKRPRCIDDGGALSAHRFTADEVSTVDYFHPSEAGQAAIAAIAWRALERGRA